MLDETVLRRPIGGHGQVERGLRQGAAGRIPAAVIIARMALLEAEVALAADDNAGAVRLAHRALATGAAGRGSLPRPGDRWRTLRYAQFPGLPGIDLAIALRAVLIWSRLRGVVSLEIAGSFASMGIEPGQLFEIQPATLDDMSTLHTYGAA